MGSLDAQVSNAIRYVIGEEERDACFPTETRLDQDLGLDSLDKLEIVQVLEDRCEIFIDGDRFDSMKTVGDVMKLVLEAQP